MRRYLAVGLLAMSAGLVQAEGLSYDYIEGGWGEVDSADGFFIGGSKLLNQNVYILGNAQYIDGNRGVDGYYVSAGAGYKHPVNAKTDVFVDAQLLYADLDWDGGSDDDIGGIGRVGVRHMLNPKVELEGSVAVSSNDLLVDDGVGFNVSARYHIDPKLSVAVGYSDETHLDGASVGLRYNFK